MGGQHEEPPVTDSAPDWLFAPSPRRCYAIEEDRGEGWVSYGMVPSREQAEDWARSVVRKRLGWRARVVTFEAVEGSEVEFS